jgi:hypothetical protein
MSIRAYVEKTVKQLISTEADLYTRTGPVYNYLNYAATCGAIYRQTSENSTFIYYFVSNIGG